MYMYMKSLRVIRVISAIRAMHTAQNTHTHSHSLSLSIYIYIYELYGYQVPLPIFCLNTPVRSCVDCYHWALLTLRSE